MLKQPKPNRHLLRISGTTRFTVEELQSFFDLDEDGKTLIWTRTPGGRIKEGHRAGVIHRDRKRRYVNGVYIRFRGSTLLAEDIAFAISNGRHVNQGCKIIHKNGCRTNNSPANLIEVAQTAGDPICPEETTTRPRKRK